MGLSAPPSATTRSARRESIVSKLMARLRSSSASTRGRTRAAKWERGAKSAQNARDESKYVPSRRTGSRHSSEATSDSVIGSAEPPLWTKSFVFASQFSGRSRFGLPSFLSSGAPFGGPKLRIHVLMAW
jgi:hypothetical protein